VLTERRRKERREGGGGTEEDERQEQRRHELQMVEVLLKSFGETLAGVGVGVGAEVKNYGSCVTQRILEATIGGQPQAQLLSVAPSHIALQQQASSLSQPSPSAPY